VDGENVESEQLAPGLAEQFWNVRVDIGSFSFETFNDQLGGKDKGPSYGAMISYSFPSHQWNEVFEADSWGDEISDATKFWCEGGVGGCKSRHFGRARDPRAGKRKSNR
jgi:hypothetical protein